jgi:uncharacterized membrane protein YgdD (TMEM256/DUF423 family)
MAFVATALAEEGRSWQIPRVNRALLASAGILGALAVAFGAFGAHGLERLLEGAPDAVKRTEWWETAALYHLVHAVAVALAGWLSERKKSRAAVVSGFLFISGIALFSGTLYAMSLGAPRFLGAITPLGGLSLIAGWIAFTWSSLRAP